MILLALAGHKASAATPLPPPLNHQTIPSYRPAAPVGHAQAPKSALKQNAETVQVTGLSQGARRAKELQKTPASTSLLTAQTLERLGVQNTRQFARLTPNLYVPNNMPGYLVNNYFIRGIGEIDTQGEPSVGTYLDGVFRTISHRSDGARTPLSVIPHIKE
ncbi:TonB-dependent receptor plug domain-containing protein [Ameyamaea chiangmaiensis]|uniref:TonB-dependent receptor plug domain-containing protein n=1 Tax=Ameyamaea chiangmaiensis TaxID=442969 RepID=UPI00223044FE|nr:Plug domain-containing protein [Ameyamaea chiangmaiensis]